MTKLRILLSRATNTRRCSVRWAKILVESKACTIRARVRWRLLPFPTILLIWLIWLLPKWFIVLIVLGFERKLDSLTKK